jgi:hypothetical protein
MGLFWSRENSGKRPSVQGEGGGIHSTDPGRAETEGDHPDHHTEAHSFWSGHTNEPNAHTRLLGENNWDLASGCGDENCRHGSFSIRPISPRQGSFKSYNTFQSDTSEDGYGGPYPGGTDQGVNEAADPAHGILGDTVADGLLGGGDGNKMSTTNYLAKRHNIKAKRKMYA